MRPSACHAVGSLHTTWHNTLCMPSQLGRRVRITQALPYHLTAGRTREEWAGLAFSHLSPCSDALVVLGTLQQALQTINPFIIMDEAAETLLWLQGPAHAKVRVTGVSLLGINSCSWGPNDPGTSKTH